MVLGSEFGGCGQFKVGAWDDQSTCGFSQRYGLPVVLVEPVGGSLLTMAALYGGIF